MAVSVKTASGAGGPLVSGLLIDRFYLPPARLRVSKTFESRDWRAAEWHPSQLRMDEELVISRRRVSLFEELGLVAALLALGAVIVFLI